MTAEPSACLVDFNQDVTDSYAWVTHYLVIAWQIMKFLVSDSCFRCSCQCLFAN